MMDGKRILLMTGASSDIGINYIKKYYESYDRIIAYYNSSKDRVYELRERLGNRIMPVKCDLSHIDSVVDSADSLINEGLSPTHIVHLAAPPVRNVRFHQCMWHDFEQNYNISFRSIVLLMEKFIPFMIKKRFGRVVFMLTSFTLGEIAPKYQSAYITTKYALYGLMRNLASEYANKGITVNGVSPDMIETRFISQIEKVAIYNNAESSPLKRNINIDDILPIIDLLLSDYCEAITGQNIGITGGR